MTTGDDHQLVGVGGRGGGIGVSYGMIDGVDPLPEASLVDASLVEAAAAQLRGVVTRTPLDYSRRLSARFGVEVFGKREDLQVVRSYKVRGAYTVIARLDPPARARGVVCASAGNHGQGLAYACAALGVRGRVYLPRNTPRQKRNRIAAIGGDDVEVIVGGDTYDDANASALADAAETGATVVPAFDDPYTIAGQGTVAIEIVAQLGRAPDLLVVPVGGGGLVAGCAAWLRERYPKVRIVGVEPAGAAEVAAGLAAGHPVELADLDTFVDGAAVRRAGEKTLPLIAATGVEMITAPEGQVCVEMLDYYASDGIVLEPAGALSTAGLAELHRRGALAPGSTVVAILSGGNNDVSRYAEVVERALVHEGRKHYFLVEFPQEPGALRRFLDEVLGPEDDITLFEYVKRSSRDTGPALVGIELARASDLDGLLERMADAPPKCERIAADSPAFRFLM